MEKVEVKFGEWLERGFQLYKENIGMLILVTLIATVLTAVTAFVLAGPMLAGVLLITLALYDKKEPKPEVGTLFKGFNYFLNSFLFVLIWALAFFFASIIVSLVPCIGQLAALFIVYAGQAFLVFGPFLIVDKGRDFWPASMESFEVVKTNFWPILGFTIVTSIIGSLGAIACGIGVIITAPIQACALTVFYRDVFDKIDAEASVEVSPQEEEVSEEVPQEAE